MSNHRKRENMSSISKENGGKKIIKSSSKRQWSKEIVSRTVQRLVKGSKEGNISSFKRMFFHHEREEKTAKWQENDYDALFATQQFPLSSSASRYLKALFFVFFFPIPRSVRRSITMNDARVYTTSGWSLRLGENWKLKTFYVFCQVIPPS